MTDKLRFTTLAMRRELPSDYHELSPVSAPALITYGGEDGTRGELELALSELPDEARPATVARLMLPEGVRLEHVDVELVRPELEGRLGRPARVRVAVGIVPEPRDAPRVTDPGGAASGPPRPAPAGYWVFVPAFGHACYVDRKEDLATRVAAELSVLPAALALDLDGWRRVMSWTPARLEPLVVVLATPPLAQAMGRRALAEVERRRLALATLESAGRRVQPADPPAPLVGRGELLAQLTRALEARDGGPRRSLLLVGDEAVGKSALVHAWIAANPTRQLWATSASELVAGASGLGEWQQRVASVLEAAEALDAVLYFDDFGALFADRPAEGGIELGAAIRAHVVDGRVRIVGELTAVALDRAERRDVSLIGAMLRVHVPATDPQVTIDACRAWAAYWLRTQPQRPQIAPQMVPTAVDLARRYLPYRAFPGKAVRVLEELRVAHDAARDEQGKGAVLGERELFGSFSWATGIPIALLDDTQALAQADVVAQLRKRMVGQDAAVARVAEAICVAKARLQPADKPLASLLFVGPSGVGKTELARSVAAYLFGAPERAASPTGDKMVRLDMSEYTDPWAAERLFGGGHDEGRLTSAVKSQPFGVVLLDEIEKAHPSVFDLLLQVLGEARLTDGRGRTTYFHNAIIVLTSNLGTRGAKGRLGIGAPRSDREREDTRFRDAVLAAFRPELVNRLDQIVVFHPLAEDEIARVAEIAIARLAERRGFTQSGVILDVSPAAIARLAEHGFSAELGARALRRHLDAQLIAPAARLLAKAGADGAGGTLTVRTPDEAPPTKPQGARLGEHAGDVAIALWRRASATGRKLVRGALALGELRRDTDRELALPMAQAVRDKLGELEATLATAARKTDGKPKLPGHEIARLSAEHARLSALVASCTRAQGELRTAEELCLEALARDVDAVELIDAAVANRHQFRRDLFFLLTGLRPQRAGATLLVHSPDARAAIVEWVKLVLGAASHLGWRGSVHVWGEQGAGWHHPWGPPHDRAWVEDGRLTQPAALVRIAGTGADVLCQLEAGLHRFTGLAGEPCHAWVDALEPKTEFSDLEWATLPTPPQPKPARGQPFREIDVPGDRVIVHEEELDVPWHELAARLPEAAVVRVIDAAQHAGHKCRYDVGETLWKWDNPLAQLNPAQGKSST
ncbi:MAG: AAA family ATPase [Acidobacteriota bacterium]